MICPMISCKRLEPYECHGSECAWWIGDGARGECAIKDLALCTGNLSEITNFTEQLCNTLGSIADRI